MSTRYNKKVVLRPLHDYHMDFGEYTPDELEFLKAIDRYKREHGPYPTWKEVLDLLKSLGWQKQPIEDQIGGDSYQG